MIKNIRLHTLLIYAGTIPFVVAALLPYLGLFVFYDPNFFHYIAIQYGIVITSFLAGVHWGSYIYCNSRTNVNLFVTSNIIAIIVWLAFILLPPFWMLFVLIITFIALLIIDYRLNKDEVITDTYFHNRFIATAIVVASLIVILFKI